MERPARAEEAERLGKAPRASLKPEHYPFRELAFLSTPTALGNKLDLTSKESGVSHPFCYKLLSCLRNPTASSLCSRLCLCSLQLFESQDFWLLVTLPFSEKQPSVPMEAALCLPEKACSSAHTQSCLAEAAEQTRALESRQTWYLTFEHQMGDSCVWI